MLNNIIVRLGIYYLSILSIYSGIFRLFPQLLNYIHQERLRGGMEAGVLNFEVESLLEAELQELPRILDPAMTVPVLFSLILAFQMTLPITWIYSWTRPQKKYNQGFAQTLLIVPIAIALVVFLVKGSLALAFSLAGIVAAVRFRTTVNEPIDAVYMFFVIGIGLAAGVQLYEVAFFASIIFIAIAFMVWKTNFGARPAELFGWKLRQPSRLISSDNDIKQNPIKNKKTKKGYNTQLRIRTSKVKSAELAAMPVLQTNAKRWQQVDTVENEDGTSTVIFDAIFKKSVLLPALVQEIKQSEIRYIDKIELVKQKNKKA